MIKEKENTMDTTAGTIKPRMTPIPATPAFEGVVAGPGNVQFNAIVADEGLQSNTCVKPEQNSRVVEPLVDLLIFKEYADVAVARKEWNCRCRDDMAPLIKTSKE